MTNTVINTQLRLLLEHATKISKFERVSNNSTKRLKRIHERLVENDLKPIGLQTEVAGDLVVRDLRKTIRLFRTLTKHQLTFTEVMIHAALPSIYGDDFFAHEVRIKQENHIDELYQYALLCCPRRFGKTYTVSIYAACLLVCVPGTKIIIFSPGKRQSSYIMDLIRQHLHFLQVEHGIMFEGVKGKDNQENLAISVKGDVRLVMGLPAKEETTRGTGGTCIICEEASSMSGKFFVDVVLPVTGPSITYCICISTIKGNDAEGQQNWYTRLLDLVQPDGKSFFNVFKIFQACQKCIDSNIAAECTHNQHDLPWWQDPEKQVMLKHVMDKLGYADSALQELVGIAKNESKPMFQASLVKKMFNQTLNPLVQPQDLTEDPKLIFVSIDPSLGGDNSRTSLMSMIYEKGQYIIVGAESIENKLDDEYRPQIIAHIAKLRTLPRLSKATIVIALENNTVGPARNILCDIISLNLPNLKFMRKDGMDMKSSNLYQGQRTNAFGVHTQGKTSQGNIKEEMVFSLKAAIQNAQIRFYTAMLMINNPKNMEDPLKDYLTSLMQQLLAFQMKIRIADSAFKEMTRTYSGKQAGPDDDAMVLMMVIFWSTIFLNRDDI